MDESAGWVKLYRSMTSCKTASRGLNFFGAMAWLVVKANYEESWYNGDKIGRGQLFCGRRFLANEWKIGQQSVRTILKHLKDDGFLTIQSTKKGSVISICNYNTYQINGKPCQPTIQPPPNQPSTDIQPVPNHLKEDKEEKELKERESAGAGAALTPLSLSIDPDLELTLKKLPENVANLFLRWLSMWELQHGNGKPMNGFSQEGQLANLLRIPNPERETALAMAISGCWKNIRRPDNLNQNSDRAFDPRDPSTWPEAYNGN